jgi:pilus assembly protein CpaB
VGNRRTLIAAAAVVLAAVSGIGVYAYASGADRRAQDKVDVVDAFVAVADIPKGTTGDAALASGLIAPARVLRGSVPPSAVRDTSKLAGRVAAATIQAHQFITDATFVAPSEGGGGSLAAAIGSASMVAVTISVDAEHGVAYQIAPGDRVNIAIVDKDKAAYLLNAVKVLAVGQETAATTSTATGTGATASPGASSGLITFELTPDDALRVVQASASKTLYLTLLPLAAAAIAATPASSASTGGR